MKVKNKNKKPLAIFVKKYWAIVSTVLLLIVYIVSFVYEFGVNKRIQAVKKDSKDNHSGFEHFIDRVDSDNRAEKVVKAIDRNTEAIRDIYLICQPKLVKQTKNLCLSK